VANVPASGPTLTRLLLSSGSVIALLVSSLLSIVDLGVLAVVDFGMFAAIDFGMLATSSQSISIIIVLQVFGNKQSLSIYLIFNK